MTNTKYNRDVIGWKLARHQGKKSRHPSSESANSVNMSKPTFSAVVVRPDGPIQVEFAKNASRSQHLERVRKELGAPDVDCEGIPVYIQGYRLTAYLSSHAGQNLARFPANRIMMQLVNRPVLGSAVIFDEKPDDAEDESEDGEQAYHKDFTLSDLGNCLDIARQLNK
jgi:hypothetical protein